jgi:hypothetical protein
VVFKHNKNKQGEGEGEGIQCIIKGISGEGHKKRCARTLHHLLACPPLLLTLTGDIKVLRRSGSRAQRKWRAGGSLQDHCCLLNSYTSGWLFSSIVSSREAGSSTVPGHHYLLSSRSYGLQKGCLSPEIRRRGRRQRDRGR